MNDSLLKRVSSRQSLVRTMSSQSIKSKDDQDNEVEIEESDDELEIFTPGTPIETPSPGHTIALKTHTSTINPMPQLQGHLLVFVRWRGWIKRNVQLVNGEILVSVLQRSLVKRHIKLTSTCKLEDSSAKPFCFSIVSTSKSSSFEPILLAAENISAKEAWTDAIQTTFSVLRIREREQKNQLARSGSSESYSHVPFSGNTPSKQKSMSGQEECNDYLSRPIVYFKIHKARNLLYREDTQTSASSSSSILQTFHRQSMVMPLDSQQKEQEKEKVKTPTKKEEIFEGVKHLPPSSYIKIHLGSSTVRTTTRRKDANPEWGMIFPFDWNANMRYAHIEVWDERETENYDELLGSVSIPLLSLCVKPHPPKWYSLGKQNSKAYAQGEVEIEITWTGGNVIVMNEDENEAKLSSSDKKFPSTSIPSEFLYMNNWVGLGGREQLFSWLFFLLIHNIGSLQSFDFSPSTSSSYHLPLASSYDGDGQVSIRNDLLKISETPIKVPLMGFPLQYPCIELEDLEDLSLHVELIIYYNNSSIKIKSNGLLFLTSLRLMFISAKKIFIDSNLYSSASSTLDPISNLSTINIHKKKFKTVFDPLFPDEERNYNDPDDCSDDSEDDIFADDTLDEEDISHEIYITSIVSVHLTTEYDSSTGNTYEGINIKTVDGKRLSYIFKDGLDNSIIQMYLFKLFNNSDQNLEAEKEKEILNLVNQHSENNSENSSNSGVSNEELRDSISPIIPQSPSISSMLQNMFKKDEKEKNLATPTNYSGSVLSSSYSISALKKIISSQTQSTPMSKNVSPLNNNFTSMISTHLIDSIAPLEKWWGHLLCISDGSYPLSDPYYSFSFPYIVENVSETNSDESNSVPNEKETSSTKNNEFGFNSHHIKIKVNENFTGNIDYVDDPTPHRFYRRLRYHILNRDILRRDSLLVYSDLLQNLKEACESSSNTNTHNAETEFETYDQDQVDTVTNEYYGNDQDNSIKPVNISAFSPGEDKSKQTIEDNPENSSLVPTINSLCQRVKKSQFLAKNFTKLFFNIENSWYLYDHYKEFRRQGALSSTYFRISRVNENYHLCPSYPSIHLVPASIEDHHIVKAASFRSKNRFPTISWMSPDSSCCIARSSQPLVGITNNRNEYDELIIKALNPRNVDLERMAANQLPANDSNPPLLIVDARPLLNARANQAVGKGVENKKNYENVDIIFMDIPNIHTIRKSYENLYEALYNNSDSNSSTISSSWIQHIYKILHAVSCISYYFLIEKRSILVHCSDGWDRTSQLVSLSMFLLDPFYHTLEGFIILIEKEWINFGHKFICRYSWNSDKSWNNNEKSPIFLQFLECVHVFLLKYPNIFEFNEKLLIFLADHAYLGFYANFMFNNERERHEAKPVESNLVSIWTVILGNKNHFLNKNYRRHYNKNKRKNYLFYKFFKNVEIGSNISSIQSHLVHQRQQQQNFNMQQSISKQQIPQPISFPFFSFDIIRINTNRHNFSLWTDFFSRFIDKTYKFGWSQSDCNTLGLKKQYNFTNDTNNSTIYSRINNFISRNNQFLNKNLNTGSTMNVNVSNWKDDSSTNFCTSCLNKFSLFRRKHHCRCCGDIFCDMCSNNYRIVPRINPIQPLRCCENCSNSIDSDIFEANLARTQSINKSMTKANLNNRLSLSRVNADPEPSYDEVEAIVDHSVSEISTPVKESY